MPRAGRYASSERHVPPSNNTLEPTAWARLPIAGVSGPRLSVSVRLHEENQGIVSTELRDVLVSILVAGGFSVGLIGAVFYFFPAMIDRSKVVARRAKLVADGGDVRRFDETWAAVDSRLPMYGRLSVFAGAFMIAAGAVVWFFASR